MAIIKDNKDNVSAEIINAENLKNVPIEIIHNTLDALRYIRDVLNRYEIEIKPFKQSSNDFISSLVNELNKRYKDLPF